MKVAIFTLSFSLSALACPHGFLPPNNLSLPPGLVNTGLSYEAFNRVIDRVESNFQEHPLVINRLWDDSTVNAGTFIDSSGNWVINLYGGFARHPEITEDGYALVLCHEIGHHLGGAPKKTNISWSSAEGQADYFATLRCLKRVFKHDNNERYLKDIYVPQIIKENCEESFTKKQDIAICKRSVLAGLSVARVMADSQNAMTPQIETPDSTITSSTIEEYPSVQCRLDTYFLGSLKLKRPLCWFRP